MARTVGQVIPREAEYRPPVVDQRVLAAAVALELLRTRVEGEPIDLQGHPLRLKGHVDDGKQHPVLTEDLEVRGPSGDAAPIQQLVEPPFRLRPGSLLHPVQVLPELAYPAAAGELMHPDGQFLERQPLPQQGAVEQRLSDPDRHHPEGVDDRSADDGDPHAVDRHDVVRRHRFTDRPYASE
jgi:hypothetical protein